MRVTLEIGLESADPSGVKFCNLLKQTVSLKRGEMG